jgi:hypothetical protein
MVVGNHHRVIAPVGKDTADQWACLAVMRVVLARRRPQPWQINDPLPRGLVGRGLRCQYKPVHTAPSAGSSGNCR